MSSFIITTKTKNGQSNFPASITHGRMGRHYRIEVSREILLATVTADYRANLPFMCHEIKLSVQLTHSDRFGVENIGMCRYEILTRGSFYSLQRCLSILQNLITLQHVKYTMNDSQNQSCNIIHLNTTPYSFAEILLNSD